MRILSPDQFVTMPWKNGGGITHEIVKREHGGATMWRLSIAEVDSDGPFSAFPGLSRILTVLEGEGLQLVAPETVMTVLPFAPVAFPGDMSINSTRIGGKVKDFNVMFDPLHFRADVVVREFTHALPVVARTGEMRAVLMVAGGLVNGDKVGPLSCVLLDAETAVIGSDGHVLLVVLRPVHNT